MRVRIHLVFVFALLASATALAQAIPPASIYSIGGMQSSPPPASITAQGAPRFPQNVGPHRFTFSGGPRSGHIRHHRPCISCGAPYYPYAYPIYVYPGYYDYGMTYYEDNEAYTGAGTFNTAPNAPLEAEPPRRSFYEPAPPPSEEDRYGEHYTDGRESLRQQQMLPDTTRTGGPVTTNGDESGESKTLLIFKDGSKLEVLNYAIMGDYIFVFAGERRKIPLAELNIPATTKANEDRGTDFHVPKA